MHASAAMSVQPYIFFLISQGRRMPLSSVYAAMSLPVMTIFWKLSSTLVLALSIMPAELSIARRTFLFTDVNSYIYCTLQNRIFRIPAFYRMHWEVLCWGMYEL